MAAPRQAARRSGAVSGSSAAGGAGAKPTTMMNATVTILLLAGVTLFVAILAWHGVGDVAALLGLAGWGLAALPLVYLLPMAVNTLAWRLLFPAPAPRWTRLFRVRWMGESVNNLLPVARVGGEMVRVRLLVIRGFAGSRVGATVVVDVTLAVLTQMGFALSAVALLALHVGRPDLAWSVASGVAVMLGLVGVFYVLQRRGLFGALARRMVRLRGREWLELSGGAEALDRAVDGLYRRRARVSAAAGWRLGGWVLGGAETWLALWLLGAPVSPLDAVILEGLWAASRAAGFAIPGALGVQEGGLLLFGTLFGLSPDVALGLSLAKRVRELALGLPGLAAWQFTEGRRLLAGRPAPESSPGGRSSGG